MGDSISICCGNKPVVTVHLGRINFDVWVATDSTAIFFQRRLKSLSSIPFIGEPCPINKTGMKCSCFFRLLVNQLNAVNDVMPATPVITDLIKFFLSIALDKY